MKIALFSDIHGNLEALEAVLAHTTALGCEARCCLGDIVGYGASPGACVDRVRALECPTIKGNHDEQAVVEDSLDGFSLHAATAMEWTRLQLSVEQKAWLAGLGMVVQEHGFTAVHATQDQSHRWGYVFNQLDAAAHFRFQTTTVCFIGHTHVPRLYVKDEHVESRALTKFQVQAGPKYLVNVGSVGQPRDGDWRAAYVTFDLETNTIELQRVEYDVAGAQARIRSAGLPPRLADRLQPAK